MMKLRNNSNAINCLVLTSAAMICAGISLVGSNCWAQEVRCDPTKVMTADACAKCHLNEVKTWKQTPHFQTFEQLGRRPEAKEICNKLGLRSVKRSDMCIKCHFTVQDISGKEKPVSGVSCESCHGASKDWVATHNDYGGALETKETESPSHAAERLTQASANGMRNTRNLYAIASSCLNCHTVPNEELVNVGGHTAGSDDFELVSWSQGTVRHNYLRNDGQSNTASSPERLRKMYVIGLIADLEFSTRATAQATQKSAFGVKVANRAARKAVKLYELQQKIQDANVQTALQAFAAAELKANNSDSLSNIADQIRFAGESFSEQADGSQLEVVDDFLPNPSSYR